MSEEIKLLSTMGFDENDVIAIKDLEINNAQSQINEGQIKLQKCEDEYNKRYFFPNTKQYIRNSFKFR